MDNTIYLALGSNLGDRRANLIDALSQLRQKVVGSRKCHLSTRPQPAYSERPA